jgi:hypothetical protein
VLSNKKKTGTAMYSIVLIIFLVEIVSSLVKILLSSPEDWNKIVLETEYDSFENLKETDN